LEADGGIDADNVDTVVCAGARVLVAGTAVFRAPEGIGPAIRRLREQAMQGLLGQQSEHEKTDSPVGCRFRGRQGQHA